MAKIQPSPAITVGKDLSIADCVRKMRHAKVGSVLVFSDSGFGSLIGIFTERDLLHWIDELQHGAHWNKSISTIMKKNPKTIPLERLEEAPQLMVEWGFRHVPVTYEEKGKLRVAGVLSMRDFFVHWWKEKQAQALPAVISKEVFLMTSDPHFKSHVQKFLELQIPSFRLHSISSKLNLNPSFKRLEKGSCFILDLDGLELDIWVNCLRQLNALPFVPRVIVLFQPQLHSPKTLETLERLPGSENFWVFSKPFSVWNLIHVLGKS
jgi:CBS domain-containing protein